MNKLFDENGHLSEYGKEQFTLYLDQEILMVLNTASSEADLQMLGCLIQKRVGDLVNKAIIKSKSNLLFMNDEEFQKYLKDKYAPIFGEDWEFKAALTKEEIARANLQSLPKAKPLKSPRRNCMPIPKKRQSAYVPHSPDYLKKTF